ATPDPCAGVPAWVGPRAGRVAPPSDQPYVVVVALDAEEDRALGGEGGAGALLDLLEDGLFRVVVDAVDGVEAQPVDPVLGQPEGGVVADEAPHPLAARAVVVDRLAPRRLIAVGEVVGRELAQVVAFRAEVVVDDVEDHAEAGPVGGVDEALEAER